MLKQYKRIKLITIMSVVFILFYISIQPINDFIQRKNDMKYNKIILDVINEKLGNFNFKVKGEDGSYSVDFRDIELISEQNEINKLTKDEANVSYVFKYSEGLTESDPLQIKIPIIRDKLNDEFFIQGYNKSEQVEITRKILEGFLEYKFDEFHSKLEHVECEGETKIVSEVVYDYSDMHYDRFGVINDASNIRFNAKKMNVLCGMMFSGEYTKASNGETNNINIEIKEYVGELRALWSVNYENVDEVNVFEDGKYEQTIVDEGMIQRIFSLINEFKYDQISIEKMQRITRDNDYYLVFNDGIFDYFIVVGELGIVIINDHNAASEEAAQDLEFFLKMEI